MARTATTCSGSPRARPAAGAISRWYARCSERGADASSANDRGWTPLHQAAYGNDLALARVLLEAGARTDICAHGDGGTRWPRRCSGVTRRSPTSWQSARSRRTTCASPRASAARDLIHALILPDGSLADAARAGRQAYRPHTGFPPWEPSDDPQEILDEALVWAAKSDRVDVLATLVELGADVDGDPYRGTALIWAGARGHVESIRRLLELGADVNRKATFGGLEHGQGVTALHLAAQSGRMGAVKELVAAGADPALTDDIYGGPAAGWAEHGGHPAIAAYVRAHGG